MKGLKTTLLAIALLMTPILAGAGDTANVVNPDAKTVVAPAAVHKAKPKGEDKVTTATATAKPLSGPARDEACFRLGVIAALLTDLQKQATALVTERDALMKSLGTK